jgi:hypothetical protein
VAARTAGAGHRGEQRGHDVHGRRQARRGRAPSGAARGPHAVRGAAHGVHLRCRRQRADQAGADARGRRARPGRHPGDRIGAGRRPERVRGCTVLGGRLAPGPRGSAGRARRRRVLRRRAPPGLRRDVDRDPATRADRRLRRARGGRDAGDHPGHGERRTRAGRERARLLAREPRRGAPWRVRSVVHEVTGRRRVPACGDPAP